MLRTLRTLLLFAAPALLVSCDNVGRAFDRVVTPPDQGPTAPSTIQVPPARGDVRDGRPVVRAANPKGGGWPSTVPIVVEFSESMNEASIVPTTTAGQDGRVVLRIEGTTTVLPALYDFLAGGRLLVMRPISPLVSPQGAGFEVAMLAGVRDADGLQFAGTGEQILASFTLDTAAPTEDGAILATYPRDNIRDVSLDSDLIVVFTKPANAQPFLSPGNFLVRTAAGVTVPGTPSAPLQPTDTRVVRFRPTASGGFAAGTGHELVVTAGITFGQGGVLRFSGRTPFLRFTIGSVPQPVSVAVGNAASGFPDKVNRGNLATLQLAVAVPAEAQAGDRVLARVYGSDRQTTATGDLAFAERIVSIASGGAQSVAVDFSGRIGSLANAKFDDGALSFAAQLQRGQAHSGIVLGSADGLQDTIAPTLTSLGPPVGSNGTDLFTEVESLVVFGTASEQLGDILLTAGGPPVRMFASRSSNTFLSLPLPLGRRTAPTAYSLAIFDLAGNESAAPATGNIFQRGVITGVSTGGNLTVEAFDDATLRSLPGVTVFVDPGVPIASPINQATAVTDADGRAVFSGLVTDVGGVPVVDYTVTMIRDGFDPITLYTTTAGFVSLPLRPTGAAASVATLVGTATLDGTLAGATAIVGSNLFDDAKVLSVKTSGAAPTAIVPTAILPNRLQVLTAFGGVFEPTSNPTFAFHACNLLGGDVASVAPPSAPVAAGATSTAALLLRDRGSNATNLALLTGASAIDFNQALSFDTNGLVPVVRFMTALDGFRGQVATGVGFATGVLSFSVTGSYSTAILDGLEPFAPRTWVMIEATDSIGSICRTRVRLNRVTSSGTELIDPQWIPLLQQPGGSSTAPLLVSVFDSLDTTAVVPSALGVLDIVARDPAGRQWRLIAEDTDGRAAGPPDDFQFPNLGSATGLAGGNWVVRASARLFARGTMAPGDFMLADRFSEELTFARSPETTFVLP